MDQPHITLAGGIPLPALGYGTYHLTGDQCYECVLHALEVGYRHIDTAERYKNQQLIGRAIAHAAVPREQITLTSKVWWDHLGYDALIDACDRSLAELATDYLDLLLVHWPNRLISPEETFGALEALTEAGKIRGYGVSNFTRHHIEDLFTAGYRPLVNQIEVHPTFRQDELLSYCWEEGIAVVAHSPLGGGRDLTMHEIGNVAMYKGVTRAEVILAWHRQRGTAAVVGASKFPNIDRNWTSLGVTLTDAEMETLSGLAQRGRVIDKPFSDFDY
ncbi:aldo/keto reductase [Patescibacteria group bacterium]|jgi:diketogulonate reductase-like aldo/keto reductase|nr:aldo/keto reductase [Patescibacteria group bacterium]